VVVEMRYTKWGGKRHWRFAAQPLGSDEFGWWYGCPAGTVMRRGLEEPLVVSYDFVVLVPAEGRWIASWNSPAQRHYSIYVDVTDRPVRENGLIEAVDLDLDVVRRWDGRVELLDEDEFEEHQFLYHYPADVIAQARATSGDLMRMVAEHHEPFGEVGEAWLTGFTSSR